jgi:hypothetical protein
MNIVAIRLHCLDMRDFHSYLRDTPFRIVCAAMLFSFPFVERKGTIQMIRSMLRWLGV